MPSSRISFGDKVAIVAADCTEALGVAGQTAVVHGFTTPSQTAVKVVGDTVDDYAVAVMLEGRAEALWFAEGLLRFVDHQSGTTVQISGRRLIRNEQGQWCEVKVSPRVDE